MHAYTRNARGKLKKNNKKSKVETSKNKNESFKYSRKRYLIRYNSYILAY